MNDPLESAGRSSPPGLAVGLSTPLRPDIGSSTPPRLAIGSSTPPRFAIGSSTPPRLAVGILTPPRHDDSSKKGFSPFDVRPIPKMAAPKTTRKNKSQKAEHLTSTPFKNEQQMKFLKVTEKKTKIEELASKKKVNCVAGSSRAKRSKMSVKKGSKKFSCLVCSEEYTEPLVEDWIQCSQCMEWAHEGCTSYSGFGSYFCDNCQD